MTRWRFVLFVEFSSASGVFKMEIRSAKLQPRKPALSEVEGRRNGKARYGSAG